MSPMRRTILDAHTVKQRKYKYLEMILRDKVEPRAMLRNTKTTSQRNALRSTNPYYAIRLRYETISFDNLPQH